MKHARLSASAAHRWLACPGSVNLSEDVPDSDSPYAALGTMAHSVASYCLKKGINAGVVIEEHAEAVQMYLDYVRAEQKESMDVVRVEVDLTQALSRIDSCLGGTADFVRYRPTTGEMLVVDFKFGSGIAVDAQDNAQLKLYALGAMLHFDAKALTVRSVIVQPRLEDPDHRVMSATFKAFELLDFAADVKAAAEHSRLPKPPINPGEEQCRWCRAAKAKKCAVAVKYAPRRPVGKLAAPEEFPVIT